MSLIDGLSTFSFPNQVQNTKSKEQTEKTNTKKQTEQTDAANRAAKTNDTKTTQLSDKAQALLKELQEKYSDTDFFVTDSGDQDAERYLGNGTKEFSVLIDAADLEAMAADEDVKNQTLSLLDDARDNLINLQEQLAEEDDTQVRSLGVKISTDGSVSYFAELEKMSQNQRERIEKNREKKAEEKKTEEEKTEEQKAEEQKIEKQKDDDSSSIETVPSQVNSLKTDRFHANLPQIEKHTTIYADTTESLLEQIQNLNWDDVAEETAPPEGRRFDFSI